MAQINSGVSTDILTIDPASNAARVVKYKTNGVSEEYVETYKGMVCSFRTTGSTATPHPLFTIENYTGSTVSVYVKGIWLAVDSTLLTGLTSVACQADVLRTSSPPSAGTILTKGSLDTSFTSNVSVVCRGATASDGGAATAITAPVVGMGYIFRTFVTRLHTIDGQTQMGLLKLIPSEVVDGDTVRLYAGQGLVVQITGTAASNVKTNNYMITCMWEEVTYP